MQKDTPWPIIGCHQSIEKMTIPERIRSTKLNDGRQVVQFFNGSKFSHYRKKLSNAQQKEILDYGNAHMVQGFAHCPYCINLARDPLAESQHLNALYGDIKAMGPAGISSVCHIGNHMDKFSLETVCRTLSALDLWRADVT